MLYYINQFPIYIYFLSVPVYVLTFQLWKQLHRLLGWSGVMVLESQILELTLVSERILIYKLRRRDRKSTRGGLITKCEQVRNLSYKRATYA
jgi:hypothetical protein